MANKKKRYTQYSDSVNSFGNSVYAELCQKLVDPPQYQLQQIDECCRLLSMIEKCDEILDKDGLTMVTARGEVKEHPSIATRTKCLVQLRNLQSQLMITQQAEDKRRKADHSQEHNALKALLK